MGGRYALLKGRMSVTCFIASQRQTLSSSTFDRQHIMFIMQAPSPLPQLACRAHGTWPCWLLRGQAGSHVPSTCAALSCRHSGLSRRPALRSAGLHHAYSAARALHLARHGGSRGST